MKIPPEKIYLMFYKDKNIGVANASTDKSVFNLRKEFFEHHEHEFGNFHRFEPKPYYDALVKYFDDTGVNDIFSFFFFNKTATQSVIDKIYELLDDGYNGKYYFTIDSEGFKMERPF